MSDTVMMEDASKTVFSLMEELNQSIDDRGYIMEIVFYNIVIFNVIFLIYSLREYEGVVLTNIMFLHLIGLIVVYHIKIHY